MNWRSLAVLVGMTSFAQPPHGVYGGYVGSPDWFAAMRRSAANTAMLQSLQHSGGRPVVPPDYAEIAAEFHFPSGNPFPKGRLPDLRIVCANRGADEVERAPVVLQPGDGGAPNFYAALKRGETYQFIWMYFAGGKDKFAALAIPAEAPKQIRTVITVDRKGRGVIQTVSTR